MVLKPRDQDFVSCANVAPAPGLCRQVDGLGSAADEHDFVHRRSVEKASNFLAGRFVGIGRAPGEGVRGPMDVGILVFVEGPKALDDAARFLGGGGIVQPHQRFAVNLLA